MRGAAVGSGSAQLTWDVSACLGGVRMEQDSALATPAPLAPRRQSMIKSLVGISCTKRHRSPILPGRESSLSSRWFVAAGQSSDLTTPARDAQRIMQVGARTPPSSVGDGRDQERKGGSAAVHSQWCSLRFPRHCHAPARTGPRSSGHEGPSSSPPWVMASGLGPGGITFVCKLAQQSRLCGGREVAAV